jgi:hypothetical protein
MQEWWTKMVLEIGKERKAMVSMIILVSWEIWKERNAKIFRNQYSPVVISHNNIKEEVRIRRVAGAKFWVM